MRLFIAEKPSLGRAIAQYLPAKGIQQGGSPGKGATHIVAGNDIISWCFGHLLEMAEPDDYNPSYKRWSFNTLPIIPEAWRLLPRESAKAQINAIKLLLAKCDVVINAGDPDREGQLLVDELLEYLGNKKPVQRIWLSALDEKNVRKALANMKDNTDYANLKASAEARQRGDWLVGMNLTRAYTLAGQQSGYQGVLSIGRVQTPTLALVVNRDLLIENFSPKDFYSVTAAIQAATGDEFAARWRPADDIPVDEAGRVLDKKIADQIALKVSGKPGTVTIFSAVKKKQTAPLPFSLSTLQATANKKLGLGAQEVVNIAQALYEAKLTTYPRTDCNYLPESQLADAARILSELPGEYSDLVILANPVLKSAAWNDKKITAHHAIIPTGQKACLSGKQQQVFDLIVRAYLAQFFPAFTYCETNITLDVAGEVFTATGKVPLSPGWKIVYGAIADEVLENKGATEKQTLPLLEKGDAVQCLSAGVESKKTTPPLRFTEGTLIQAMTNIHNLVEDPELKRRLKETAGIGTEATRAGIIETLKKRLFIMEKGKQIISTQAGRVLIGALPDSVKSPGLTGLFEQFLDGIAEGRFTVEQFLNKQIQFVSKFVNVAKTSKLGLAPAYPCTACKTGHLRRRTNDKGVILWTCVHAQKGCQALFQNLNGKPDLTGSILCPDRSKDERASSSTL